MKDRSSDRVIDGGMDEINQVIERSIYGVIDQAIERSMEGWIRSIK